MKLQTAMPVVVFILTMCVGLAGYGYRSLHGDIKELYGHTRGNQQLLGIAVSDINHNRKSSAILFQKGDEIFQRTTALETHHDMTKFDHKNINLLIGDVAVLESRVKDLKAEVAELEREVFLKK